MWVCQWRKHMTIISNQVSLRGQSNRLAAKSPKHVPQLWILIEITGSRQTPDRHKQVWAELGKCCQHYSLGSCPELSYIKNIPTKAKREDSAILQCGRGEGLSLMPNWNILPLTNCRCRCAVTWPLGLQMSQYSQYIAELVSISCTTKWHCPNIVSRGRCRTQPDSPEVWDCFVCLFFCQLAKSGKWNSSWKSNSTFQGRCGQNEGRGIS